MKSSLRVLGAGAGVALLLLYSFCTPHEQRQAVLMKVKSIRGSMESGEMILILQEEQGARILPLSVGGDQALAIHLGHQHVTTPRPMTHDLMANIFKSLAIRVERITITDLKEGTYFAEIVLQSGGKTHRIDARPSDAIALSLRVGAPVYAMADLLLDHQLEEEEEEDTGVAISHPAAEKWGLSVQELTPALADFFGEREGILIADVTAGSPAERGGLTAGDILRRIDQQPVRTVADFLTALARHETSQAPLPCEYWRDGRTHTTTLHP
ncbi:MAG: DUF151 domain-containing protein [candidate division KSB1 bacterium]|nr:DUF151 domain-containing protein [candidate division KSB1 bacterium]MDZ7276415.1 DUF151 domain-containing protein [candidate division KSB1 bacterium]MDZ7288086.1 DUF151 domain-containing protein [candidate division KSB1 bacterium]MDZ7300186.1 DUF151 domain-containing protein [candidate division KSB1 bacterium]MDZ7305758.1 DUF151 domain-containing protein [candidate division KSB1 bacterium]